MALVTLAGLDDLRSGCQQDSVGVWFGSEDPVAVIEVVGEGLGDLVRAAVLIGHRRRGVSFTVGLRVRVPWGHPSLLLLGLNGNQGRRQP